MFTNFHPGQSVTVNGAPRVVAFATPTHVVTTRGEAVALRLVADAPSEAESGAERSLEQGSAEYRSGIAPLCRPRRPSFAWWGQLSACVPHAA